MNRVAPPQPAGDDPIDALLGAFFKGEMPDPWPAFQPPARSRTLPLPARRAPVVRRLVGSRVALAASVALLLLCGWLLGGKSVPTAAPGLPALPSPGSADRDNHYPSTAPTPAEPSAPAETRPSSRVSEPVLEHKDGRTGVRIDVDEPSPER
jgi:hypothetical protein